MKFYPPMYLAEEFLWVLSSHSSGSAKESEELAFEEASRARARVLFGVRADNGRTFVLVSVSLSVCVEQTSESLF